MGIERLVSVRRILIAVLLAAMKTALLSQGVNLDGRIHLDVVVSDATGKPVAGLQQQDFRLFDDGVERPISSFSSFNGETAKADPPAQMIVVIDAVNNGFVEMAFIRQGLVRFLRENGRKLAQPTTIARLTASGIQFLSASTRDGNALAYVVERMGPTSRARGLDEFGISMKALASITNKEVKEPGRKVLIWLRAGWPTPPPISDSFTQVDERNQTMYFKLGTQLTQAMQAGRLVLYGGYSGAEFYQRSFLKLQGGDRTSIRAHYRWMYWPIRAAAEVR